MRILLSSSDQPTDRVIFSSYRSDKFENWMFWSKKFGVLGIGFLAKWIDEVQKNIRKWSDKTVTRQTPLKALSWQPAN